MAAETHSFIDLAALEEVRPHFAAADAAVILSVDLAQVLWCNGPGAALLGFSGIEAAIGSESGLSRQARRQIESVPGFPAIGWGRPVNVRLAAGMISQSTAFRASHLVLPGEETAILLVVPFTTGASRDRSEVAARAIEGFEEPGNYLALLDQNGTVLAATPGFDRLGVRRAVLDRLIVDVATGTDRLVKRLVRVDGRAMPVGFARLTDEPPLHLLITVDESQLPAAEAATPTPASVVDDSQVSTAAPAAGLPAMAEPLPAPEAAEAPVAAAAPAEGMAHGQDATSAPTEPPDGSAQSPQQANPVHDPAGPAHDDSWYFGGPGRGDDAKPAATLATEPAVAGAARPTIERDAAPVRFVWRTDTEGRFSSISPEFAAAVGITPDDLVGQRFADIARLLTLDPDGEINGLLERRDTWSGRSVSWPIKGTGLKAPVDLAALPAYGRDRQFEGFRGFGVLRIGEAVEDPQAIGLSLGGEAHEADAAKTAAPPSPDVPAGPELAGDVPADRGVAEDQPQDGSATDPFRGEVPALDVESRPQRRSNDKVISLAEHRAPANEKGLTPIERNAFREIGEQLRRASGPTKEMPPVAPQDSVEPPASEAPPAGEAAPETGHPSNQAPDRGKEAPQPEARAETEAPEPPARDSAGAQGDVAEAPSAAEAPPAGSEDATQPPASRISRSLLDFAADDAEPTGEPVPDAMPKAAANDDVAIEPAHAEDTTGTGAPPPPIRQDGFLPSAFAERGAAARRADTSILAQLPVAVLIHSGDVLHYANGAFLSLTGYADLDELAAAGGLNALLSGPADDRAEGDNRVMLRPRSGEEFPVSAFLQSVHWLGGKALLLTVTRQPPSVPVPVAAVTPAEDKELQTRVAELRTILDTATDGVVLIDNDGMVRSISRPAEALFGYDSDQVAGRPFTSLFAIESQRAARDYLAGLSDHGVASVLNDGREVIGREAQGRFIPLFMTIGRLPGDTGFCAVLRDITQWKRAEEELTQARAQAERTSSQKSDFLARVSHEIRTPLNAIIGFSELMLDEKFGPVANDRYRDYLRDINRSGNHVLDLVNDLLDISKIEAGQQEMDYEAVALNDALAETVALMQPQANRERVIIRSSFASKLPEVVADLRSVRQIALNILSNAVRFTQAGGQVIVSTAHEPNGEVVMRVRDTGVGMTQAEIEQALKPFKQVSALKRARGEGTGLGLPLTKAMVEANRAKFSIYSTPGEGTLVEVTFPSTRVLAE